MVRRLPAVASDEDRLQAAKIASDQLCAQLRESELARSLWLEQPSRWQHEITPSGWVVSRLY